MNFQSIHQLRKAIRNGFERHWLILILFTIYMSSSANRMPQQSYELKSGFASGLSNTGLLTEVSSTKVSRWGDIENVAEGHDLTNPKKNNRYANIAFLINEKLKNRDDVTPAMMATNTKICTNYVRRFAKVARAEMHKYGIPASITLAQGLLESDAGGSLLSRRNNNHFGMKCFSRKCKKGHCSNFTDDSHKDFFRIYKNSWQSYRAHSKLLMGKRYRHLKKYGKDYKKWAFGLRKAGYATDPKYAQKLIAIIDALHLYEFDE
ncbi:MAG TPA: hypothetical protein ENK85_07915 [Saprospiraceae bacterium]|nr:hypothetical protein [Saprospiraceae bacterium]